MWSWSIESLSLFSASLSTDSSKLSEETGKAWAAWCRGRISSLGGVPPPPSLSSLSLYLFLSPPPAHFTLGVALTFWPSWGAYQTFLFLSSCFWGVITSEQTMCWHGDEEDEDSSEVKCLFDLCVPEMVAVISSDWRSLLLSSWLCLVEFTVLSL